MRSIPIRSRPLLIALTALCLGLGGTPSGSSLRGPTSGIWELPDAGASGFIAGALYPPDGGRPTHAFTAKLVPWDLACPACIAGDIRGELDDGSGPGPDYLVRGYYAGTYFDGSGRFEARVLEPSGTAVGWIRGRFADPPGTSPGSFRGRYRIGR